MEEILHQMIDDVSHYLRGFYHPFGGAGFRWPIHSIIHLPHYLFTIQKLATINKY